MEPRPDTVMTLEPGVRRIIAPNPSAFTYWGTNTYVLGQGQVAVIDPGPDDPAHLDAILGALNPGEQVSHILITHSHLDHSPLATALREKTGAPVLAYGNSFAGRSEVMNALARDAAMGGGEGVDPDFAPDDTIADGQVISGGDWSVTAIWTPGHLSNHMCFEWNDVLFSGDHVMEWATSIVSPPDGDLTAFMASTAALIDRPARIYYPGHGDPVTEPLARTTWLRDHRLARETAILDALNSGAAQVETLTRSVYTDIAPGLIPAAMRNVFAHLIDLHGRKLVKASPELSVTASFERI